MDLRNFSYLSADGTAYTSQGNPSSLSGDTSVAGFLNTALLDPNRAALYLFSIARIREDEGLWAASTVDRSQWGNLTKVSDSFPWSLTAALTPGAHHVRLYLETQGKIDTIISKKDDFTDFYDRDVGDVQFFSADGSRLAALAPRDPNVSVSDLGVFVMTWDNRPADIGPGHPDDARMVVSRFGLAFSVDGLNWTVYDPEMLIPSPIRIGGTLPVRHVVPIFITDDQIRIYFTTTTPALDPKASFACTLATAISN